METRKRRSAAEWSSLVGQWRASGLSTKVFAARHGLSAASLYWWRQRLQAPMLGGSKQSATASSLAARKGSSLPIRFTEVLVSERSSASGQLEVVARSGNVIRVQGSVDAVALRTVLAAVERC